MSVRGPVEGDAFGAALLCHLESGDEGAHLVERDDGYASVDSAAGYFRPADAWSPTELHAMAMVKGRVLDVGAGAGRAALYLQDLGHDVLALDVSAGAVEVCRRRGVRRIFLGSVGDLAARAPEGFDTFLFFGQNVGLIGSPQAAPDWFGGLRRLARPGARLVGTLLDPYVTDDPAHLDYHEHNRKHGRMAGQLSVRVRYGLLATPWFGLLWMSGDELRSLAEPLGWRLADHRQDGSFQSVVLEMH